MAELLGKINAFVFLAATSFICGPAAAQSYEIEITTSGRAVVDAPAIHGQLSVSGQVADATATQAAVEEIARTNGLVAPSSGGMDTIWTSNWRDPDSAPGTTRFDAFLMGTPAGLLAARDRLSELGLHETTLIWSGDPSAPNVGQGITTATDRARSIAELAVQSQGCALSRVSVIDVQTPTGEANEYRGHPVPIYISDLRTEPSDEGQKSLHPEPSAAASPIAKVHINLTVTFLATCPAG